MPLLSKERFGALSQRLGAAMTQRTPPAAEPLMDFKGGLSLWEPYSLAPNQVRRADNLVLWRDGRLRRRLGYTRWGLNALGAPSSVTSLFQFITAAGVKYFLASTADGKVYKDAGAGGTWTTVATGLVGNADVHPKFKTFANQVIMVDKNNAPQTFDGTTWAALGGVNADTNLARVLEAYQGRLWLGAEPGTGSRIRYSAVSNPASYATNDFLDISINDGEDIQTLMVVQNQLFVAKRTQLFVVMGDSSTTYGWFRRTKPGVIAPDSVQVIDNIAYFLSDDGVYAFDGVRARKVSWELDPLFEQASPGVNLSRLQYAQSAYFPMLRQYWLLVSSAGSSTLDTVYVGHIGFMYKDEADRLHLPFTKFPSFAMNALGVILDANEIYRLMSGDANGKVFQQDDGSLDDAAAITWTLETRELSFSDLGHLKLPQYADLILDDIASGTMTVNPLIDFSAITPAGITVNLDGGTDPHIRTISLPEQAQMMRLQLTGSTGFGIRGILPSARPSKGRR